jgi:hypothetical protein
MLIIELFTESKKITTKNDPCWKGYHMVGTKKKGSKTVPNCVPGKKEVAEDAIEKRVFLNKRDQLFKRLAAETDPKNKEIIRQAIKQLEQQSQEFLPKAN